ncbi:VOC family protein [Pseudoflavitalea sp. G-6-1-2]|uniref:VOC family protein n=1 Tax=Pseudoflavitalea sp. G-6-1-2 TaxID=2728841 RepID=UPI00146D03A4|nr:VOC family protein [Pseudoflavitalea sp. G-6-1-2]NML20869.1 VOC family protein [Pseudoflavitalea sp. G-6-1-2]
MQINHLNFPVSDVAQTRSFFEKHFNFTCREVKGDNMLVVLENETGFVLTLMSTDFNRNGNSVYPDAFHMGFLVNDQETVRSVWKRLSNGGVVLEQEPRNMRGVFGFYLHAPGNILIEVSTVSV